MPVTTARNKTRINFIPVIISRLTGTRYHHELSAHYLHKVHNLDEITLNDSNKLGKNYVEYTRLKDSSLSNDINVDIPKIQDP